MAATSESVLRHWVYEALDAMGGKGRRASVLDWIEKHHGQDLSAEDLEYRESTREEVWRNNVSWVRQHLVNEGLLINHSEHGQWELSERGRSTLRPLSIEDLNELLG